MDTVQRSSRSPDNTINNSDTDGDVIPIQTQKHYVLNNIDMSTGRDKLKV